MTLNEILQEIIDTKGRCVSNAQCGICYHVRNYKRNRVNGRMLSSELDYLLDEYIGGWKHYSGNKEYPIPGGAMAYRSIYYDLWEGEQLEYRLDLCRYLIKANE